MAPSPFNGVKLELAVVLVLGAVVMVIQERFVPSPAVQFCVLLGYGLGGMGWIIARTRRVLAALDAARGTGRHGPQ